MATSTGRELGRQLAGRKDWSTIRDKLVTLHKGLPTGSRGTVSMVGDAVGELINRTQPAQQTSAPQQAQTGTGGGAGQANPEQRAVSLLTDLIAAPPRPGEEDWLFQHNMLLGG